MELEILSAGEALHVTCTEDSLLINGKTVSYAAHKDGSEGMLLSIDGKSYLAYDVESGEDYIAFTLKGHRYHYNVKYEQAILFEKMGFKSASKKSEGLLKAPMPGKILDIRVQQGDTVEPGQTVIILEAMKMENELKIQTSGTVIKMHVGVGTSVEKNATLIEIG